MKTLRTYATRTLLAAGLLFGAVCAQAELAIIAHPGNSLESIDQAEVERIYLGRSRSFPGGGSVKPLDQAPGNDMRDKFFASVLNMTEAQVTGYWSRRMFSGKGTPPDTLADDLAVKARVASDPNSLGYVREDVVDSSVKVLLLIP
ncbi:MAG: phosphate ABC transporter substrate-binding protein [Gammaproteobacteria bacterium]|nr:phosphate ABC transporter substrate-binding protein [Gammaproteobacteria bacterium]MCW9057486.1 phosphate ABC transporter substrate-binding protein [Gammaproteobacteria bacterium]